MSVRILRDGKYSDFSTAPKVGAQVFEAGVVVDFPLWYGTSLVASGLAEEVVVEETVVEVDSSPHPSPPPKGEGVKKPRRRRRVRKMGDARSIEGLTGADPDGLAGARKLTE